MSVIRPEVSVKNKYWIDRHRYYELKHFCLQYKQWKKEYASLNDFGLSMGVITGLPSSNEIRDLTSDCAIRKVETGNRIKLIESTAMEADVDLWYYIVKAVTEGLAYTQLKTMFDIPCSRDMYYDRYRRFFWLLDKYRN